MALTLTRGTTRARPHCTYCLKTVITKAWRGREHTGDGRVGPVTWGSFRWEARNRKGASRERCTRGRGERPGRDAVAPSVTRQIRLPRTRCRYCVAIAGARRGCGRTDEGRVDPITFGGFQWEARDREGASRPRRKRKRGERPGRDAVAPSVTKQLYLQRTRRRYCRAIIGVRCRYKCTRQGPRNPVTIGTLSWKA